MTGDGSRLGHDRGPILRPLVQRYPEEPVSPDVGTEGDTLRRVVAVKEFEFDAWLGVLIEVAAK